MMPLQTLQRNMLMLIKERSPASSITDNYLLSVKNSKNLRLVQKIVAYWRTTHVREFSPLTGKYLLLTNGLDKTVRDFTQQCDFSNFKEEVGIQFLEYVAQQHPDTFLQTLARFEADILMVRMGHQVENTTTWQYEPYQVIASLLHNQLPQLKNDNVKYRVNVSYRLESIFNIEAIPSQPGLPFTAFEE